VAMRSCIATSSRPRSSHARLRDAPESANPKPTVPRSALPSMVHSIQGRVTRGGPDRRRRHGREGLRHCRGNGKRSVKRPVVGSPKQFGNGNAPDDGHDAIARSIECGNNTEPEERVKHLAAFEKVFGRQLAIKVRQQTSADGVSAMRGMLVQPYSTVAVCSGARS